ncbi:hypothetical protein BJV78DRAFT_1205491, partial [Lactifluus subvellereus]
YASSGNIATRPVPTIGYTCTHSKASPNSDSRSSTKRASTSSPTARADKHQCEHRPHSPTEALPPPRVVHRVQAVIEVPHTSTPTGGGDVKRHKSSAGSHHRTEVARSDSVDEGEEGPPDEVSGGEYVDEGEVENAGMGTLTAHGKTMPWGRKHIFQQPDEEDDELMMYASLKVLLPSYSLDSRVHRSLTRPTDFTG